MKKLQLTIKTLFLITSMFVINQTYGQVSQAPAGNAQYYAIPQYSNFTNPVCHSIGIDHCGYTSNPAKIYVGSPYDNNKPQHYFHIETYSPGAMNSGTEINPNQQYRVDKSIFIIDKKGNVGIGTVKPSEKFHIKKGNSLVEGNSYVTGSMVWV